MSVSLAFIVIIFQPRPLSTFPGTVHLFLKTFARKFCAIDFFLKILPLKDDKLVMSKCKKKMGVTDFVLERICPEEHLNLSKSGFVSEEGHSGCKSQNIAI